MANKNLTDLTARTATADSDLIHVNSGGTDYKETKRDFLQGDFYITFGNTSTLTSQIDALPSLGTWFGRITGYGAQSATGLPINANCNIEARKYNGNYVEVDCFPISATVDEQYRLTKVNGTWQSWVKLPTRSEITSINSSLTNIGTRNVTYYASNATSATFAYTGVSFTITKKSIVRADLYYTYSTPQEIAICGSASGNQSIYAHSVAVSGITNVQLGCTALLAPGTYYIWGRSGAAANNNIGITGYQIEP